MEILSTGSAPRYRRPEGITSYLLVSPRTSGAQHLTTTLVVVEPGGEQRVHSHVPEQVYFVLEGTGLITVGSQTRGVGPGDCIFVPSQTPHGLRNDGTATLRYFSASAPAFAPGDLLALWPLGGEVTSLDSDGEQAT
jgi:mannose-6-phosphate isomerase-like protein (cupin superfamily)